MGTTIKLQTCFALSDADSEMMRLPEGVKTVADLLCHLGEKEDFNFIEPESGELEEELEIILNTKEIWFYPTGLNMPLNDGDIVEIYLLPLGGG